MICRDLEVRKVLNVINALDEFIRKFADAVLAAKRSVNNEVLAV